MAVAVGKTEYLFDEDPVSGLGVSWTGEEMVDSFSDSVSDVVFDVAGNADIAALLDSISSTDFDATVLKRILGNQEKRPENWRVGEAIAESYLAHNRSCFFPWPDGRDARCADASLPGADLVGLRQEGAQERFVFGEVKTSSESKYPPGVVHGRSGLQQQLEVLRDNVSKRDHLVKYLLHRMANASWRDRFITAYKAYQTDSEDIRLFGVLIRDVSPHQDDLRMRIVRLKECCPKTTVIELVAIYLPLGSVETLGEMAVQARQKGAQ